MSKYVMNVEDYFITYRVIGHTGQTLSQVCPIVVDHRTPQELLSAIMEVRGKMPMEICITFRDNLMIYESESLMTQVGARLDRFIKRHHIETCKIALIMEHSVTGRPHIHGLFGGIPNDVVRLLKNNLRKAFGRIEIKMIKYDESYIRYIFKAYIVDTLHKPEGFMDCKIKNQGYETWNNGRYYVHGVEPPAGDNASERSEGSRRANARRDEQAEEAD